MKKSKKGESKSNVRENYTSNTRKHKHNFFYYQYQKK